MSRTLVNAFPARLMRRRARRVSVAYFVAGFLEFLLRDLVLVVLGSEERGFIDDVGQLRARVTGSAAGDDIQARRRIQFHIARVDFQNRLASANIRPSNHNPAIETARPQQRRIQHVRTIGRRHQDHAFVRFEAVHFHQQLVQRLFALVMTAA